MTHTGTSRPFTRTGPPTEDDEREALRQRRAKSAKDLPALLSIARTALEPAQPTIDPPSGNGERSASGGQVGAHDQITARLIRERELGRIGTPLQGVLLDSAELRAADQDARRIFAEEGLAQRQGEEEQRRIERNVRLVSADKDPELLPSEREDIREFNRREAQRKHEERRHDLNLPPTADQIGESVRVRAAREALIDRNMGGIPLLIGTPAQVAERAKADPQLIDHGQLVRSGDKVLKYNAFNQSFTPVRQNPLTGKIEIDTSDLDALTEADRRQAVLESLNTLETLEKGASRETAPKIAALRQSLEATMVVLDEIGIEEAIKIMDQQVDLAARLFKPEEEPEIPVERAVADRVHTTAAGQYILQPNDKLDFRPAKDVEPPPPTTPQEFFSQGSAQEQARNFFAVRKVAVAQLEAEAKREIEARIQKFNREAQARHDRAVSTSKLGKARREAEAAEIELFEGSDLPEPVTSAQIETRMQEVVQQFLKLRGPVAAPAQSGTAIAAVPRPAVPVQGTPEVFPLVFGFTQAALEAIAEEDGITVEEVLEKLRPRTSP